MRAFKNILVATDFSEVADGALSYGRIIARQFDATLRVLHVVDDVYLRLGGDVDISVLPDLQKDIEGDAHSAVTATLIVTSNDAAAAIVNCASPQQADLIAVSSAHRAATRARSRETRQTRLHGPIAATISRRWRGCGKYCLPPASAS